MEKKRQYYQYLITEVARREKVWNESRATEQDMATEYSALSERFGRKDPGDVQAGEENDYVKFQLMKDVHDAQANLADYKQEENRLEKEITQRKRTRVEPPGKTDAPPKKLKVHHSKRKSEEEIADQASTSIARFCMDWQETMGSKVTLSVPGADSDAAGENAGDPSFVHEDELRAYLWPKSLETPAWGRPIDTTGDSLAADVGGQILRAVEDIKRVQHLHTLALQSTLEALGNVRRAIAKDGNQETQLSTELKAAQRATLLATDGDLKSLPFRSLTEIDSFFLDGNRVAKLGKYLCTYIRYSKKYPQELNAALLHPDLQAVIYWPGTVIRGYMEKCDVYEKRTLNFTFLLQETCR